MTLAINSAKCIGCKLCQLGCSGSKEERFNPKIARLSVESYYEAEKLVIVSKLCTLCGECSNSCPTSAIKKLDKRLSFEEDLCTNCGTCVDRCPEKVIVQKENTVGVCDLCQGEPWCVKSCPHGALTCEGIIVEKEAKDYGGLSK